MDVDGSNFNPIQPDKIKGQKHTLRSWVLFNHPQKMTILNGHGLFARAAGGSGLFRPGRRAM